MDRETLEKAYQAALDAAARQLSYRGLSVKALREKLMQKGHTEDAADYALAWLTERRLLDDSRFAEDVVRSGMRRGYGQLRIRQELYKRGIDRETAEAAMQAAYAPDDGAIYALLDKKLKGDTSDPKAVQRAVAYVQRRGYQWGEIRRALTAYGAAQDDFPDG